MTGTVVQALNSLREQRKESGGTLPECVAFAAVAELVDVWESYGDEASAHYDADVVAEDIEEAITTLRHILAEMRASVTQVTLHN